MLRYAGATVYGLPVGCGMMQQRVMVVALLGMLLF